VYAIAATTETDVIPSRREATVRNLLFPSHDEEQVPRRTQRATRASRSTRNDKDLNRMRQRHG
jgi:hypothetical protein